MGRLREFDEAKAKKLQEKMAKATFTLDDFLEQMRSVRKMGPLKSLMGKKGAVIIFIATKCPVSNAYNDRMEKLAQDYKAKGVNVIGINANNTEPAAEVKAHAADKHLTFTILKDDGNKLADRLGATRTPEDALLAFRRRQNVHLA